MNWKEILPDIPTNEVELETYIWAEQKMLPKSKALLLVENAVKEWPVKIRDPELQPGDNQILAICGSCYLQGLYITYMNVVDRLDVLLNHRDLYWEQLKKLLTTEQEVREEVYTERRILATTRGEMRMNFESALEEWGTVYQEPDLLPSHNRILGQCVSCYLHGIAVAGDMILRKMEEMK